MGICVPMYYLYANICDIETFKLTRKLKELCTVPQCVFVCERACVYKSVYVCVCVRKRFPLPRTRVFLLHKPINTLGRHHEFNNMVCNCIHLVLNDFS